MLSIQAILDIVFLGFFDLVITILYEIKIISGPQGVAVLLQRVTMQNATSNFTIE